MTIEEKANGVQEINKELESIVRRLEKEIMVFNDDISRDDEEGVQDLNFDLFMIALSINDLSERTNKKIELVRD